MAQLIESKFDSFEEEEVSVDEQEIDEELQKKIEDENIHYD